MYYGYGYGYGKVGILNPIIDNLFTDSFNRVSLGSSWTSVGATTSLDGSDLTLSGGTGDLTKYIYKNDYVTDFENESITMYFKVNSAINATSYGIAVGFSDASTWITRNVVFQLTLHTGNTGRIYAWQSGVLVGTGSETCTISQNDELLFVVTRNKLIYTCTCTNLTNPGTTSLVYTLSLVYPQTYYTNLSSYISIHACSGSQKIHSISLDTTIRNRPSIFGIGDSIMGGLYSNTVSGSTSGRYMDILSSNINKSITLRAGPSDRVADASLSISNGNEFLLLRPSKVLIHLGTNDIAQGIALGTIQTQYQELVSQFNCEIYHCLAIPRNGVSVTAFNSWLQSTYTTKVIDTYTPLNNAGNLAAAYNSGDNVHPNIDGHLLLESIIRPYLQ